MHKLHAVSACSSVKMLFISTNRRLEPGQYLAYTRCSINALCTELKYIVPTGPTVICKYGSWFLVQISCRYFFVDCESKQTDKSPHWNRYFLNFCIEFLGSALFFNFCRGNLVLGFSWTITNNRETPPSVPLASKYIPWIILPYHFLNFRRPKGCPWT